MALAACHRFLGLAPAPVIDGFTGDQRVFIGWASMWRAKFNPNFVRNHLVQGSNAPPSIRGNSPFADLDTVYAAFSVQPGDRMFQTREQRVHLW